MSGFMFFVLKYVTGPRPLNSSPTPPVYAWSVSQDLVDRTLSDHNEDGFFDVGDVRQFDCDDLGPFDDSVVDHFDLMVILTDIMICNLYDNITSP